MANDVMPFWEPGQTITAKARATIGGKRFVKVSGGPDGLNPGVVQATAGDRAFGVCGNDVVNGVAVTIWSAPGAVVPVIAGATLTQGQEVQSDANGAAIPLSAGKANGMVLADCASGAEAVIKIY